MDLFPSLTEAEEVVLIAGIALWTLPWKGVALWKAAHLGEKNWFVALLILNTLAILEIVYIFFVVPKKERAGNKSPNL